MAEPSERKKGFFERIWGWLPAGEVGEGYGRWVDHFWRGDFFKDPVDAWTDSIAPQPPKSSDGYTPASPKAEAFLHSFGFIISFIILGIVVSMIFGKKVATYFFGLVLLSMVLINADKITKLLNSSIGAKPIKASPLDWGGKNTI
jgi:hypothetical protein